MKAIAGLGNPGIKYSETRHNFGFMVIDKFAEQKSAAFKAGRGDYVYSKINPKLIHYAGIIVDEAGNVSSFSEHVLAHVDMNIRKTSEMPDDLVASLNSMLEKHNSTGPIDFELRLSIK